MHAFLAPRPAATGHLVSQRLATAAQTALACSVALGAVLHVGWSEQVDPVGQTLSDYALHEGAERLFAACVGAAATGSVALLGGLLRSRLPVGRVAPAALGVGGVGLVLSAVFRTDPAGSSPSVSGLVHRHAAGAALAALPTAGLLLSRRLPRTRRILLLSRASSAAALLFLGTHLCASRPDTPTAAKVAGLLGLAERVTLGLEVALLFAMADALPGGQHR
ncbi:DUF998 domain-containing protein [Streptomyces sp. NPDC052107]|uniref:DUF998 domain-containing protein n=1 Tax=Streptomyces sp. NPDC052107 TaxID=3155632 RepID=UPI0034392A13